MLSEPLLNFSTNFHIILGVMMLGHLEKFTNNFFLHKYHLKLLSRNFRKRGGGWAWYSGGAYFLFSFIVVSVNINEK